MSRQIRLKWDMHKPTSNPEMSKEKADGPTTRVEYEGGGAKGLKEKSS
jgi:hypothetical protein